jgi:hypothetical protein
MAVRATITVAAQPIRASRAILPPPARAVAILMPA